MTRTREENAADMMLDQERLERLIDDAGPHGKSLLIRLAMDHALEADPLAEALQALDVTPGDQCEQAWIAAVRSDPEMAARAAIRITRQTFEQRNREVFQVFGEPDLFTGAGNRWFIIRNEAQADLASSLGQTAIGHYWKGTRKRVEHEDSHEWMIMLDWTARAAVSMAAKKEGHETLYAGLLADCHVTGLQNQSAFREHEADIRDVCAVRGLVCKPNHIGSPLRPDADDSPSP